MAKKFFKILLNFQYQFILGCFLRFWAGCNEGSCFASSFFPHFATTNLRIKGYSQQPIILEFFLFQRLCLLGFAYAFAAASIFYKISSVIFWFFNCERKLLISSLKFIWLSLSLFGCFGLIYSFSCTHPGSSRLSRSILGRPFLPPNGLSCLSDSFSNFFYGFLLLFYVCQNLTPYDTENGCAKLFVCFFLQQRWEFHYHLFVLFPVLFNPRCHSPL